MSQAAEPNPTPPNGEPDPLEQLQDRFGPQLEQAQAQLEGFNDQLKTFIRKNPGTVLIGAAAFGYLLGRWASRR